MEAARGAKGGGVTLLRMCSESCETKESWAIEDSSMAPSRGQVWH
jgi:hypothetical protein